MSKKISRKFYKDVTAAGGAAIDTQTIFSSQNKKNLRLGLLALV